MIAEPPAGRPPDAAAEPPHLDQVRRQAVRLLTELDRPPRTLRLRSGDVTLDISWPEPAAGAPSPARDEAAQPQPVDYLSSPGVGVFYRAKEPGAEPFVSVGGVVRPGDQIGIIEAMKMMIPVEADRAGVIGAVLKSDGEPVEYGEPLFALAAEGETS